MLIAAWTGYLERWEKQDAAVGLAGFHPQRLETIADGVHGEGQEVHGREQHGEVLLAMAEIMLEMVAVVFENIEAFVLDLPPRPRAGGNFGDALAQDVERGDEGAVAGRLAFGVGDGEAEPIDLDAVLVAQRRFREPSVAAGELSGAPPCG
ncbi:hypothetical protein [Methylosinus sp. Sm6]|uniref:hypothetical protein n=1 Tax=Methylosinus sp. Sm6 TaxID=2866948 RepID=UPI001C99F3A2|nr:hypothetical protein [Methylosinus sp. Sm6]MBY6243612.1 hypothetical protein [Methylosinus sp. Sm6]